jgi:hypothetical protein
MSNELDVVNFTNIDAQDYEGMWGGEITTIKSGETKQFPRFLAEHYCKHLVNKILIRGGQDWSNEIARKPLEDKILGQVAVAPEEEDKPVFIKGGPVETEFAEAPKEIPEQPVKKGGRPKKK